MSELKSFIFPRVFITGEIEKNSDEHSLCTDALLGWACCLSGGEPPKNFGCGMAAISKRLGVPATTDSITKFAISKNYLKK